jgi:ActR/RegA family two-component response regulator
MTSMDNRKKVIIVEDNQHWLETLELILGSAYDLTLFADPAQALESLKENKYHLAILDKNMPTISGLELLRKMRAATPRLKAIILTGYADVDSAVESMKIGARDYISKGTPNLPSALIAKMEEALASDDLEGVQGDNISTLISGGESATLEFKSSARWDFRAGRMNKDLEWVIVKTVGAFMNSEHYCDLLIGVSDDGEVIGLEHDYKTFSKKQNRDAYENFLMTLLLEAYGKDYSPHIQIIFHYIGEKEICQIHVKPAQKPAFARNDKGEHLFIRAGNSTRQLSMSEAYEYCKIRWGLPHST